MPQNCLELRGLKQDSVCHERLLLMLQGSQTKITFSAFSGMLLPPAVENRSLHFLPCLVSLDEV